MIQPEWYITYIYMLLLFREFEFFPLLSIFICFSPCHIWQQDNLSAIDILSACNLVNYFGKMVLGGSGVGQISLYPILMRKVGAKNL